MIATLAAPTRSPRSSRRTKALQRPILPADVHEVGAVKTRLGWMAVTEFEGAVTRVSIGHDTRQDAILGLSMDINPTARRPHGPASGVWLAGLLRRLKDYAAGVPDDFRDVPVDRPDLTPFGRRVMEHLRKVGYGETVSYGELARRAGSPGAARAVGQVMATNLTPIILPCHRVLASRGRLGGFSAPHGIELKRRLLELEGRESI